MSLKIAYKLKKKKRDREPSLINDVGNQTQEYIFSQKKIKDRSIKLYSYFLLREDTS